MQMPQLHQTFPSSWHHDAMDSINLKAIHKKQILFNLLLAILFVIFSLILGPFIYSFWLNDKFHVNLTILSLIVFDAFFAVIKLNLVSVLQAINNWFRIIVFEFSFSLAVLIFSVIFFMNNYNYYVYFYLSLTASFIILAYSFYESGKFYNKIKNN